MILNLNTGRGAAGAQPALLVNIIQKLRQNPMQATRFLNLHDGNYQPKCTAQQIDNATVIDIFQVQAIIEYNTFGCNPVRSLGERLMNTKHEMSNSSGIWVTASYINHACDGNAARTFVGDMMILRASCDIAEGDEILTPYFLPEADNMKTIEKLQKGWNFKCECRICFAEGKMSAGQRQQRQKLIRKMSSLISKHVPSVPIRPEKADITRVEQLYRELKDTYEMPALEGLPRLGLVPLDKWLCQAYALPRTPQNVQKAREWAMKTLQHLGIKVIINKTSITFDRSGGWVMEGAAVEAALLIEFFRSLQPTDNIGKPFQVLAKELNRLLFSEIRDFEENCKFFGLT